jgi:adenylosuccinate lyase
LHLVSTSDELFFIRKRIVFYLTLSLEESLDNVASKLVVYPARINSRIMEELPFMVIETIIMRLVSLGKSQGVEDEEICVMPHRAGDVVRKEGGKNDSIERIKDGVFCTGQGPDW